MLPLKLVRSLVLGESINKKSFHSDHDSSQNPNPQFTNSKSQAKTKYPFLLFTPTNELITDTYRLASLSREIGLDFHPNPSLSHLIFSWPATSSPATTSSSMWSTTSLSSSSSWSLPNDAIPMPFPLLEKASLCHLRAFVGLSKGYFKLVFLKSGIDPGEEMCLKASNWDCCSVYLVSRRNGERIDSMEGFSRALAGAGWTFYKTNNRACSDSGERRIYGSNSVYLFKKMDLNKVRIKKESGGCRVRELRLPHLDFVNAPLRILQYILLMTDDIFYLA